MSDAEFLKRRLAWIFARRGGNGQFTRLFDDLDDVQKGTLDTNVRLLAEELPVLGNVEPNDRWFVLTTQRIVWGLGGQTQQLSVSEIWDASIDLREMISQGVTKDDVRELEIETTIGERYAIGVESGRPLFGVLNVLKNLGDRARARGQRSGSHAQ